MGLFNTLHHGRLAALHVMPQVLRKTPYIRNEDAFDYSDDGRLITFQEAWENFRINDQSDFVELPATAVIAILTTMLIFHVLASTCILKQTLKEKNGIYLVSRGFQTLISPPLHFDWHFYFMDKNEVVSVQKCWKRYVIRLFHNEDHS